MATSFFNLKSLSTSPSTHFLFFSFIFFFLLTSANSIEFQISRFDPDATNIIYEGDAIPSSGGIEFNLESYSCRIGRATYADKVRIRDSDTEELSDFSTHFSFIIDTKGEDPHADGLAFFIAPAGFQIPLNSAGGFLGLFNTTTMKNSPRNQILVVEFDSYPNPWDPEYEHVGININSIISANTTPWNASLHSGDTAEAWITCNATTKNLNVSWSYRTTSTSQENTTLSYQIDLMEVLPEWVTIGFTAATGTKEHHRLESWDFNSSLEMKEKKNWKMNRLVLGLIVSFSVLIAGGIVASLILWWKRHQMKGRTMQRIYLSSFNDDLERSAGPRRFSYKDLVSSTKHFSNERKLGEGGFGGIYRGYLNDLDMVVAVKKISRGSKQGRKEYVTEVKTIGRLRHRNLVQLIGWCHDSGEFLLVYECMQNGSLDSHLFGKKIPLTWVVRYKIALGLASALLYLHEEWEQCVVHRDIKSSNIMLDSSFNVKLGDFGLARLMDHELGSQTTGLAGTPGYLAPECISTGKASKESDVFSFGVVALEIATGRKAVDKIEEVSHKGLVDWVWNLYGKGNLLSAVDERLRMDYDEKEVGCLMNVGLWCAHPDRSLRPSIRQAIQVLNFEIVMPNLPNRMPVPMYHVPTPQISRQPSMSCTSLAVGR